ncbi:MAG: penicillin-binding protein 1A [Pseudomonadota bacterium]|nr:penicillin-binding protein 1A [Pseudomonadota bacterium]
MKKIFKLLLGILGVSVIFVTIGSLCIGFVFWHYGRYLPDYQQLINYEPPTATRLHAGDGRLLKEFARENRVFVPIDSLPKQVINAFVAAEDQNFFSHGGIDLIGVVRAIITNIQNFGSERRLVGASTITQQVAKNFLLTNEVSLDRKLKEAILAFRIDRAMSKGRILELYLNEIYLGMGSYGVAAAALNYFDKSLDDLTIHEAAFLAGLPKAPNNYHPLRNPRAAVLRRNYVIGRMLEDGYISATAAIEARNSPLVSRKRSQTLSARAEFFVEEVRRELKAQFGEKKLYGGGLSVRSTLDPRFQSLADEVLRAGLENYDQRHGYRGPISRLENLNGWEKNLTRIAKPPVLLDAAASWRLAVVLKVEDDVAEIGLDDGSFGIIRLSHVKWRFRHHSYSKAGRKFRRLTDIIKKLDVVLVKKAKPSELIKTHYKHEWALKQVPEIDGAIIAMDPHTGRVLAVSGGYSFARSEFNRATQALRQPGSAFKPFVYLAAMEHGFGPASIVLDAPFVADQGPGQKLWKPSNYTKKFYGPSTLRLGIEKSRNLITVRLAQRLGMEVVSSYAERFGVAEEFPELLSASLGAAETTLLKLTTAYAMLVNGGKKIVPTFIDRVQDRLGKTIFKHEARSCDVCNNVEWKANLPPVIPDNREQLVDPQSAYQVVSMLEGVVKRGTGIRIKTLNRSLAGKTGTTNQSHDAWFVGFSPDLAVGIFVGFDRPKAMGRRETGSSVAVPIFRAFMEKALKNVQSIPFRIPSGVKLIRINAKTGTRAQGRRKGTIIEAFKFHQNPNKLGELGVTQFKLPSGSNDEKPIGEIEGLY